MRIPEQTKRVLTAATLEFPHSGCNGWCTGQNGLPAWFRMQDQDLGGLLGCPQERLGRDFNSRSASWFIVKTATCISLSKVAPLGSPVPLGQHEAVHRKRPPKPSYSLLMTSRGLSPFGTNLQGDRDAMCPQAKKWYVD